MNKLAILSLVLLVGCAKESTKLNDTNDSAKLSAEKINQIQSQEWCMERTGLHLGAETVRISFDKNDLDESGKMKIKFDTLIKNNSGWTSYELENKSYDWDLAPKKDAFLSHRTAYLNLINSENSLGSKNYLEYTTKSLGLFSKPGLSSSIFRDCPEGVSNAVISDRTDYALYLFVSKNELRNEPGYVPWDLNFPTTRMKASEVYNQWWCQSERFPESHANEFKVIYFGEKGDIIYSRSEWNERFDKNKDSLDVRTSYLAQKYFFEEATGQMKIYSLDEAGKPNPEEKNIEVEFRKDGKISLMITHDKLNQIFYDKQLSSGLPNLSKSSVYYNCSSIAAPRWLNLRDVVKKQINKALVEKPNYEFARRLPYF